LIGLLGVASLVVIGVVAFDGAFGDPSERSRGLGHPAVVGTPFVSDPTTPATTGTTGSRSTEATTTRTPRTARPAPTTREARATSSPAATVPTTTAVPTSPPSTDLVMIAPGAHYAEQVQDAVRMLTDQGLTVSVRWVSGDGTQPQNTVVDVQPTGSLRRGTAVVVSAVDPEQDG
jgi:hypothetical protein